MNEIDFIKWLWIKAGWTISKDKQRGFTPDSEEIFYFSLPKDFNYYEPIKAKESALKYIYEQEKKK